jgi:uncharacterized protein YdbL (DUF1318 family)
MTQTPIAQLNRALALAAVLATGTAIGPGLLLTAAPAWAQSAAKATVEAAKAAGKVGEQADGYLGLVTGSASPDIGAAVAEINGGRAAVYRETATKTGVTVEAAGQATAAQLLARVHTGQYYRPLNGTWTKK